MHHRLFLGKPSHCLQIFHANWLCKVFFILDCCDIFLSKNLLLSSKGLYIRSYNSTDTANSSNPCSKLLMYRSHRQNIFTWLIVSDTFSYLGCSLKLIHKNLLLHHAISLKLERRRGTKNISQICTVHYIFFYNSLNA